MPFEALGIPLEIVGMGSFPPPLAKAKVEKLVREVDCSKGARAQCHQIERCHIQSLQAKIAEEVSYYEEAQHPQVKVKAGKC